MVSILSGIIILTITVIVIWYHYGKNSVIEPKNTSYPPFKINSGEFGTLYSGGAGRKEIASLIIYLANQGYIKIEGEGICCTLIKLKEYDGYNHIEEMLMKEIFSAKNYNTYEGLAVSSYFYRTCNDSIDELNKEMKKYICEESLDIKIFLSVSLCILGILLLMLFSFNNYSFDFIQKIVFHNLLSLIFPTVSLVFMWLLFKENRLSFWKELILVIFGGVPMSIVCININLQNINIPVGVTGLICLLISFIFLLKMPKRSGVGKLALEMVLGMKIFFETASEEELSDLLQKNPDYCFEMLPYAYVLGVEDIWIKKMKNLVQYPPKWLGISEYHPEIFYLLFKTFQKLLEPTDFNGGHKNIHMVLGYRGTKFMLLP